MKTFMQNAKEFLKGLEKKCVKLVAKVHQLQQTLKLRQEKNKGDL